MSNNYKREPISKLVFYTVYPPSDMTKEQIEKILLEKLTLKYHLSQSDALTIISNDTELIKKRCRIFDGEKKENIDKFYFSDNMLYDDILEIFFKNVYSNGCNFSCLTFSEIIRYSHFFFTMHFLYEYRIKALIQLKNELEKNIDSILFSSMENDDKLVIVDELQQKLNNYKNQISKEKTLKSLYEELENALSDIYENTTKKISINAFIKKIIYLNEYFNLASSIEIVQSEDTYESIETDAFAHDMEIISKYKKVL